MATLESYLRPIPSYGGAEYLNRQAWAQTPPSADSRLLNQSYLRSKQAHDVLMRSQAMEAEQDNAILNSATPDELANLMGPPRTPREERLQRIVQRDVNAKNFGVRLIGTPQERLSYEQGQANLQRTNLQNYLDPLRFGLDEARFGETQDQNMRNWYNQQQQRIFQDKQLSATERYRQMQNLNAEANRRQRGEIHQQDYQQRQQMHGDRMANFQSEADRKYYQDVAQAAASGALSPTQVTQMFQQRFDPATMAMLRGYAQSYANENPDLTANKDPGFFSKLGQYFGFGTAPAATAADAGGFEDDDYIDGSGMDMGADYSPVPSMGGMPPRGPTPQRAPATQQGGAQRPLIVQNRRTGQKMRVMADGSMAPMPGISAAESAGADRQGGYVPMPPRQAPVVSPLDSSEFYGPPMPPRAVAPVAPASNFGSRFSQDWAPIGNAVAAPFSYLQNAIASGLLKIPAVQNAYGSREW